MGYDLAEQLAKNGTETKFSGSGPDIYACAFGPGTSVLDLLLRDHPDCDLLIFVVAVNELVLLSDKLSGNLIQNGGFEVGPYHLASWSSGVVVPPNPTGTAVSPLPGWTTHPSKGVRVVDSAHFHVPQGNSAVMLAAGNEGSAISQHVSTFPGKQYTATFIIGNSLSSCRGPMEVEASTGLWSTKVVLTSLGERQTVTGSLSFHGAAGATTTIVFSGSFNQAGGDKVASKLCAPVLDDVRVYQVNF